MAERVSFESTRGPKLAGLLDVPSGPVRGWGVFSHGFTLGKAILKRPPGDVLLVSTGVMLGPCLGAADLLKSQGIACGVLHMHTVKPIDADALTELARKVRLIVTVEEHVLTGGLGSAVLETLSDRLPGRIPPLRRLGLPDAATELTMSTERVAHWAPLSAADEAYVRDRLGFALDSFGYD